MSTPEYEWEKMAAAWTANSAVDENWVCRFCLCCSSSLETDAAYDVPMYANFLWTVNLLNVSIFRVQIDLLFIIFVCSLYTLWATIRLLHHFGFVWLCAFILGYPVCIFRAIDAKYVMFRIGWCKSLKGSATHASFLWETMYKGMLSTTSCTTKLDMLFWVTQQKLFTWK